MSKSWPVWLGAAALLAACSSTPAATCLPLAARPFDLRADDTFLRGPWIAHAAPDSLVIDWDTAEACPGRLELARAGEALATVAEEAAAGSEHRLEASGLTPDTRYTYRVSCGPAVGQEHTAYTAPAPGAAVRFAVLGDSQSHPEVSSSVAREILPFEPHFVLHAGDAVGDGQVQAEWDEQLYGPLDGLQDHAPLYFAVGNHEQHGDGYFRRCPGALLSPESPAASCFAVSQGNVFVLVVDTENLFFPLTEETDTPISAWIRAAAASPAARAATWRVLIGHQPARAEGWGAGSCEGSFEGNGSVAGWLLPLLAEHGFQAYYSGHTHAYERGLVAGVHTFVTGGGGGGLDVQCRDFPEIEVFRAVHHHLRVSADCEAMTVEAWALGEGAPFDTVTIPASQPAGG